MSTSESTQQALQALGLRLRELRKDAGLTARELARRAGWHDGSKVSKIEHGRQTPTAHDIRMWTVHCGATEHETDLVTSLHAVEGMYVEWRRRTRAGLRPLQNSLDELYRRTKQFRIYEPGVIPGLFQTPGYAAARMRRMIAMNDLADDVEAAVTARIDRQRVLHTGEHRFAVVLEEWALRARLGSVSMMMDQLHHLATALKLPQVSLGVIPQADERSMWSSPGFWIFDDQRVLVETPSAELTITQPREVALYLKTFAELRSMAVHGGQALALISAAIADLEAISS